MTVKFVAAEKLQKMIVPELSAPETFLNFLRDERNQFELSQIKYSRQFPIRNSFAREFEVISAWGNFILNCFSFCSRKKSYRVYREENQFVGGKFISFSSFAADKNNSQSLWWVIKKTDWNIRVWEINYQSSHSKLPKVFVKGFLHTIFSSVIFVFLSIGWNFYRGRWKFGKQVKWKNL